MILVTVGTHDRGFDRLIRAADELAAQIDEPVVIQYGSAKYVPQHASRSFRFTTSQEMEGLTSQARVIIMHAAAGSLILALRMEKPLVVVPRLKKYHEHLDNHQMQLAKVLAEEGRVIAIMQPFPESLLLSLEKVASLSKKRADNHILIGALRTQIRDWNLEEGLL